MNKLYYFSEYSSINESKMRGKSDIGIIGPLDDSTLKIRIPKDGEKHLSYTINDGNVAIKYRNNSVSIPEKCCEIDKSSSKFDVVNVKTDMNWFKTPQNTESFDSFIEAYIDDMFDSDVGKINNIEEDANILCDLLGIQSNSKSFDETSNGIYELELDNGMQVELTKRDKLDPFKGFRVYINDDEVHPAVTMKRKGGKTCFKFRTKNGVYECEHDSLHDALSSPGTSYLVKVCLRQASETHQRGLVDHLMKLFKYHKWDIKDDSSPDVKSRYENESKELKQVMEMLKNTISEKHIEEMYTNARQKFTTKM